MADALVELVFPPWCAFKFPGFVAFFANAFGGIGVWIDFEVGFGGHGCLKRSNLTEIFQEFVKDSHGWILRVRQRERNFSEFIKYLR